MPDLTLAPRHLDGAPRWAAVAWIAARQHGVITTAQLHTAGVDKSAIRRALASGRLHRLYRGVHAVGHRGLSREGLWTAGVLAGGAGAALSHLCCAALWGAYDLRTDFVTVVAPKARRPRGPLRVYECRNLDPRDVTVRRGIRTTTVARMLVDLTDVLEREALANVIYEAEYRNRFSEAATRAALARANGRHRLHVLDEAMALNATGSAGTRSAREQASLAQVRRAGLSEPRVNTTVEGIEVDLFWPEWRLIVDVDGPGHGRRRAQRVDARKEAVLGRAGHVVIRVAGAGEIVEAVKRARATPRPGR